MRKLALVSMLALFIAPAATASWSGDIIWAMSTNWNAGLAGVTGNDGREGEIGVAAANISTASMFIGGDATTDGGNNPGLGSSELLGDSDPQWGGTWGTRNVTAFSRSIIMYDDDTALELAAGKWGNHDNVWLTQVEHVVSQPIQNAKAILALGETAWVDISGGGTPNSGGQQSGRIQLATDGAGVHAGGADPRLMVDGTGGGTFGMLGSEDVYGLARDASGDLYIAGRAGLNGVIVKVGAPGSLANAAGQRIGDVGVVPAGTFLTSTPFAWYTGIVQTQGVLIVNNRGGQTIDVIDENTGAVLGSYGFGTETGLVPEDLAILDEGQGVVRLVVNVLDPQSVAKLAIVDLDTANAAASSIVNLLQDGALNEAGDYGVPVVDAVYVSPGGDIVVQDSRANNDDRFDIITAESLAAALTGDGSLQSVNVDADNVWQSQSAFRYAKGMAFNVPEPATLALLAMGGLAVIRRRK